MPATQDAGPAINALLEQARVLQDEAAAELVAQKSDWQELGLNIAVRRSVIETIHERIRRDPDIAPATLGRVYDALLDRRVHLSADRPNSLVLDADHRKAHGIYYTPRPIVDQLVHAAMSRVLADAEPDSTITVLDPACGTGWFLLGAIDWFARWLIANSNATLNVKLHLVGADIDPVAIDVARLSLSLALRACPASEQVTSDFVVGNSLLGPDCTADGIAWNAAFPAIMKHGGFDIVIGNPPYVSYSGRQAEPLPPAERQYIEASYSTDGWLTAHGLFIERAARDLSRRITAMVVPDQVGHLAGYRGVRGLISKYTQLAEARYWGEDQFAQAVTPVLTFIADRRHRDAATIIGVDMCQETIRVLGDDAWRRIPDDALWQKLAAQSRYLGEEVADPGVHTGNCAARLILPAANATGDSVPVLEGRQVSRYACEMPTRVLRMDYEAAAGEYFRISAKARFTRAAFVIRQTAAYPIVGPRLHADYFRNSLLALYPPTDGTDIRYLVGLLNSNLMRYIYKQLVAESGQKAFPQVKVRSLRLLPIRRIDMNKPREKAAHDRIASLVQTMLDSNGESASTDEELDHILFDLYGMSDSEVCLVLADGLR